MATHPVSHFPGFEAQRAEASALYAQAQSAYQEGDHDHAVQLLQCSLKAYGGHYLSHMALADLAVERGEISEARRHWQALKACPFAPHDVTETARENLAPVWVLQLRRLARRVFQ